MLLAVSFTNLGPYHVARLRALAEKAKERGTRLLAIETSSRERKYPWLAAAADAGFERVVLFPGRELETVPASECARAMRSALEDARPNVVATAGYVRPECLEASNWCQRHRLPAILMSESQEIDRPRVWWKERVKSSRIKAFSAALVGGESHRDYLIKLGFDGAAISYGYDAVDNAAYARGVREAREIGRETPSPRPYFLAVNRFAAEKNLERLLIAYANHRERQSEPWDLVLLGDGPLRPDLDAIVAREGLGEFVRFPGFADQRAVIDALAFASGFVHPAVSEPWGLAVNEAAAAGLPLLVSDRAGCVETLVPNPPGTTGYRFHPESVEEITACLCRLVTLPERERRALGARAASVVSAWGPDRFASGLLEAVDLASRRTTNIDVRRRRSKGFTIGVR